MNEEFNGFDIFDNNGTVTFETDNNAPFMNEPVIVEDSKVQEVQQLQPVNNEVNTSQSVVQGTRVKKSEVNNVQQTQTSTPVIEQPVNVQQSNNNQNLSSKDTYSDYEWREKMNAVDKELRQLEIDPTNLNSSIVAVILSKIDVLLTNLVIDSANIKSRAAIYDAEYKLLKQLQFQAVKEWAEQNGVKLTVDDKWSLVSKRINDNKTYENNMDVFHLAIKYQGRATELEDKINLLKNKQSMMITYCGLLKLDYSSNNITPSVPTQNQFNQMRG